MSDADASLLPEVACWFRFAAGHGAHVGAFDPEDRAWFDLGALDVHALLARGGLLAADLDERRRRAAPMAKPARFLQPLPHPGKILCLAKNYAAHARELGGNAPGEPIFFAKLNDTLCGPGDPVVIPHWLDTRVDHEAELAVVLGFADDGRGRKNVDAADAMSLVAGYTLLNDVTARALQGQDRDQKYPWLRSKAIDTFGPFGPFVAPADAYDAGDRRITMRVNGAVRQDARTSQMLFPVAVALAAMSRVTTLRPGDLIAMGTPEGVGPVVPGDLMEVAVEGLGVLRNPVEREGPVEKEGAR